MGAVALLIIYSGERQYDPMFAKSIDLIVASLILHALAKYGEKVDR